jgi:hypothetical protein
MNNRLDHNIHKFNRIKEIINSGHEVVHTILEWFDENKTALKFERNTISTIGRVTDDTGPLLNVKKGDETPRKTEMAIKQCNYCTGEVIQRFKSTGDAAVALGVKWPSSLNNAVRKFIPSYMGYIWCYDNEEPTLPTTLIYQWTQEGVLIAIHKNEGDARRMIGGTQGHLHQCINSRRPFKKFIVSRTSDFPGIGPRQETFPVWTKGLNNKAVIHVQTQIIYPTVTAAAKACGHCVGAVSAVCKGNRDTIAGNIFKYVELPIPSTTDE